MQRGIEKKRGMLSAALVSSARKLRYMGRMMYCDTVLSRLLMRDLNGSIVGRRRKNEHEPPVPVTQTSQTYYRHLSLTVILYSSSLEALP